MNSTPANSLAGEYRRCVRHGLAGMYGFISVDREPGPWGGYAEYDYLARDSMMLRCPTPLIPLWRRFQPIRHRNPLGYNVARHQHRRRRRCAASGRYPFASLPPRCAGLDDAEDLLATIGERDDVPPVDGVLTP